MILADSAILIEWQRKPSIRLHRTITAHDAAICGVTVTEVLAGARTAEQRDRTMELLSLFGRVPMEEAVWELAGDMSAQLRRRGTPLMLADLAIAAAAVHHGLPLWTRDAHFERVQAIAPDLVLFDETAG